MEDRDLTTVGPARTEPDETQDANEVPETGREQPDRKDEQKR